MILIVNYYINHQISMHGMEEKHLDLIWIEMVEFRRIEETTMNNNILQSIDPHPSLIPATGSYQGRR